MVAFEGETNPQVVEQADQSIWLKVGQLGKMIRFFKDHGVDQCVMAGRIAPKNLFDVKPDLRAAALLFRYPRAECARFWWDRSGTGQGWNSAHPSGSVVGAHHAR